MLNTCLETIFILPEPEDEVEKVIQNLKGKLLAGIKVPDWIGEKCMKLVERPVTDMCNATLGSGICPDRLKFVIIKHLHKKGDIENIQNYKPKSLIPFFSKIQEKFLYTRLIAFIIIISNLPNDRSKASSKMIPPHSAI
jgi:hypothetical protein